MLRHGLAVSGLVWLGTRRPALASFGAVESGLVALGSVSRGQVVSGLERAFGPVRKAKAWQCWVQYGRERRGEDRTGMVRNLVCSGLEMKALAVTGRVRNGSQDRHGRARLSGVWTGEVGLGPVCCGSVRYGSVRHGTVRQCKVRCVRVGIGLARRVVVEFGSDFRSVGK